MQVFLLANTPLFVVRKLKADPFVLQMAQRHGSHEIMQSLMVSLSKKPTSLKQAVLPYVYLVALAIKPDLQALNVARRLDGQHHDWYNYVANALFQMTPSVSATNVNADTPKPHVQTSDQRTAYSYHTVTA
jgi:hypothetical protein